MLTFSKNWMPFLSAKHVITIILFHLMLGQPGAASGPQLQTLCNLLVYYSHSVRVKLTIPECLFRLI
jgi:hypothetical protein